MLLLHIHKKISKKKKKIIIIMILCILIYIILRHYYMKMIYFIFYNGLELQNVPTDNPVLFMKELYMLDKIIRKNKFDINENNIELKKNNSENFMYYMCNAKSHFDNKHNLNYIDFNQSEIDVYIHKNKNGGMDNSLSQFFSSLETLNNFIKSFQPHMLYQLNDNYNIKKITGKYIIFDTYFLLFLYRSITYTGVKCAKDIINGNQYNGIMFIPDTFVYIKNKKDMTEFYIFNNNQNKQQK